jgi:hypothetical protein
MKTRCLAGFTATLAAGTAAAQALRLPMEALIAHVKSFDGPNSAPLFAMLQNHVPPGNCVGAVTRRMVHGLP